MFIEHDAIEWLASDNGFVVHISIFVLLILGGLGFPVPEDIPLLLAGVAASKRIVGTPSVFGTCYAGVMAGDQIMFFVGHFFGQRLVMAGKKSKFFPSITDEKLNEVREGLRKRRLLYIFLARHLFPIRSVTFLTAGALRVPYLEFLVADALAGLVSVSLMMWLGYMLGGSLTPETIQHIASEAHVYILAIVAVTVFGYIGHRMIKRRNS